MVKIIKKYAVESVVNIMDRNIKDLISGKRLKLFILRSILYGGSRSLI